jgi:hypothetical protein
VQKALKISGAIIAIVAILIFGLYFMYKYNSFVASEESLAQSKADLDEATGRRDALQSSLTAQLRETASAATGQAIDKALESTGVIDVLQELKQKAADLVGGEQNSTESEKGPVESLLAKGRKELAEVIIGRALAQANSLVESKRDAYNKQVSVYNQGIRGFPSNCVAWLGGFRPKPYYNKYLREEAAQPAQ